jgi:hypothetical protein
MTPEPDQKGYELIEENIKVDSQGFNIVSKSIRSFHISASAGAMSSNMRNRKLSDIDLDEVSSLNDRED